MTTLLRWIAASPALLASTAIVVLVASAMPAPVQVVWFYAGLAVAGLLWCGIGEGWAVRVLYLARPVEEVEVVGSAPLLDGIAVFESQLALPELAQPVGRRSILVRAEVISAVRTKNLSAQHLLVLLLHSAAQIGAGHTHRHLAVRFWSLPWLVARAVVRRLPLVGSAVSMAWNLRTIVGAVAVVQGLAAPTQPAGSVMAGTIAGLLMASFGWPLVCRASRRRGDTLADQAVIESGYGPGHGRTVTATGR